MNNIIKGLIAGTIFGITSIIPMFFMEFEGHKDDSHIAEVLAKLESSSLMIKIMGSYPRAVI